MAPTPLDTTQLDALLAQIEATPDEVDGLDLRNPKQEARFQTAQARASLMRLRKLATPLSAPAA